MASCSDAGPPVAFFPLPSGQRMAYRYIDGDGPVLVFLPGYMSDMAGSKAVAMLAHAAGQGRAALLLDYTGCGLSDGDFADGKLSQWRDEVWALVDGLVGDRSVVLMGSSMGGWLMLLMALARPAQVAGLVGIAAAPDFTAWGYTNEQKAEIAENGVVYEDNPYGPEPTPIYTGFWEDGQAHVMGNAIALNCPVHLLHGQNDADVPWELSLKTAAALAGADVLVTLIKDGDHRLSRPTDIAAIIAAYEGVVAK